MERKTLGFSITEIKERTNAAGINVAEVEGYAAYKNNLDLGNDRILDGAFKKGLRKNKGKWPVLVDHNYSMRSVAGENNSAKEDEKGLFVKFEINLDTQVGKETTSQIKLAKGNGRDIGLSIGYLILKWTYEKVKGIQERHLEEIEIVEHSIVVFPMNPKATITTVKSILEEGNAEAIAHKKRSLEQALRDDGCSESEAKVAITALFAMRDASNKEAEEAAKIEHDDALFKSLNRALSNLNEGED